MDNRATREMAPEEAHGILRKLASVSASENKLNIEVADLLFALHAGKAHERLGYDSFYSMLAENNVTYKRRTVNMLTRAGWVMAVARLEGLEDSFAEYSVAKLEMVATPFETFLHGGQKDEAKRFLLMAREIDHGGLSRADIRKAMIEANLVQPTPKRYIVCFCRPGARPEMSYVITTEDPSMAPSHVQIIAEVKRVVRSGPLPMRVYKTFGVESGLPN